MIYVILALNLLCLYWLRFLLISIRFLVSVRYLIFTIGIPQNRGMPACLCSYDYKHQSSFFSGTVRKYCSGINLEEILGFSDFQVSMRAWSACGFYTKTILYQPQATEVCVGLRKGLIFCLLEVTRAVGQWQRGHVALAKYTSLTVG